MEHRQNSAVFRWVVVGIGVCLFLVGCRDKSVNRVNQERDDYADAKYDQAISDYGKAIEIDPDYASAYNNRTVGGMKNCSDY